MLAAVEEAPTEQHPVTPAHRRASSAPRHGQLRRTPFGAEEKLSRGVRAPRCEVLAAREHRVVGEREVLLRHAPGDCLSGGVAEVVAKGVGPPAATHRQPDHLHVLKALPRAALKHIVEDARGVEAAARLGEQQRQHLQCTLMLGPLDLHFHALHALQQVPQVVPQQPRAVAADEPLHDAVELLARLRRVVLRQQHLSGPAVVEIVVGARVIILVVPRVLLPEVPLLVMHLAGRVVHLLVLVPLPLAVLLIVVIVVIIILPIIIIVIIIPPLVIIVIVPVEQRLACLMLLQVVE
mmetsp:Transcript_62486/g.148820  ORF Transcript_62486/g.148820 Transcript_62486/m.148820 type:complete len:294 (-) Transcript_62486:43-924(-)